MNDVTILIATHGEHRWSELAQERAFPSAQEQDCQVVHIHRSDESLASVRNFLLNTVTTEWVTFLDADDELEPGYVDALLAAKGDIRAPGVRYVLPSQDPDTFFQSPVQNLAGTNLDMMNYCVIGSMVRTAAVREAGGFWEEPAYEDWSLFRRMWMLGAVVTHTPEAVYRVHVSQESRNNTVEDPAGLVQRIRISHAEWLLNRNGVHK